MSMHKTLKLTNKNLKSVKKRLERFQKLREEEKWHKGDSVFALPKEKVLKFKKKPKEEKEKEESTENLVLHTTENTKIKKTSKDINNKRR